MIIASQENTKPMKDWRLRAYILLVWISMHAFAYFNEEGGRGFMFSLMLDILMIPILISGFNFLTSNRIKHRIDHLVILYIGCNFLSLHALFLPSMPTNSTALAYGIHGIILPIFIYFFVRNYIFIRYDRLIMSIVSINLLYTVYGLYINYLSPYTRHFGIDRFHLYFNSSVTGNICAVSLCALAFAFRPNKLLDWFATFIFLSGAFLSAQRSAIICSVLSLLLLLYIRAKQGRKVHLLTIILFLLSAVFFTISQKDQLLNPRTSNIANYSYIRLSSRYLLIEEAFSQRTNRYQIAMDTIVEYPLGVGVGTTTFDGATYFGTFTSLCDANFMRILVDSGILGFLAFIGILFSVSWTIIKSKRQNALPGLFIVLIYSIQALGTAVFDNMYTAHTFWLFLGISVNLVTANLSKNQPVPNNSRTSILSTKLFTFQSLPVAMRKIRFNSPD